MIWCTLNFQQTFNTVLKKSVDVNIALKILTVLDYLNNWKVKTFKRTIHEQGTNVVSKFVWKERWVWIEIDM